MSGHLRLFEIWLTSELPDGAFVLAARPQLFLLEYWIVVRHRRQSKWLVSLNFKVQELDRLKWLQVIEVDNRLAVDLLHERCYVCLILKWEPDITLDATLVETELELHIGDVFLLTFFSFGSDVQGLLPILCHKPLAVLTVIYSHVSEPLPDLCQSLASSHSNYLLICNLQEYVHKSLPHGKMVVFEDIPLWLGCDLNVGGHHNFVAVNFGLESANISLPHFIQLVGDEILPHHLDAVHEIDSGRWVTNALKELDSFLPLQLLEGSILLQECPFCIRHLHALGQTTQFISGLGFLFLGRLLFKHTLRDLGQLLSLNTTSPLLTIWPCTFIS